MKELGRRAKLPYIELELTQTQLAEGIKGK